MKAAVMCLLLLEVAAVPRNDVWEEICFNQ